MGEHQAPDYSQAEGASGFGPGPETQGNGQSPHKSGAGGHHDGPETDQTALINGLIGTLAFVALGLQGEVDHHDGVLFDDTHQHDDPHKGINTQFLPKDEQG